MGRSDALHRWLPVMLGLGLHYGPTTAFFMVGTALVILIVAVYIVMNAACIGFFSRSREHKLNLLSHVINPEILRRRATGRRAR